MKKLAFSLLLSLCICLAACGSKDESKENSQNVNTVVDNNSESTTSNDTTKTPDESNASSENKDGKNEVGEDKNVTDDISKTVNENVYNVGGVLFQIPDTFKKKNEYVGAKLTFESTKNQSVLYLSYVPYDLGYNATEDFEAVKNTYMSRVLPLPNASISEFIEDDTVVYNAFSTLAPNYFKDSEEPLMEEVTIAGLKAIKYSVEGTTAEACYREGPVKSLVKAKSTSYLIINDVESRFIVVDVLSKSAKAEETDKLIAEMLASAVKTDEKDNMTGRYSDTHAALGGFSFDVPDAYGMLSYYSYYTDYETYFYQYYDIVNDDSAPSWWTNINVERVVMTKAEFEENVDMYMEDIIAELGDMFADNQGLERKNMEIDGMQAVYYHSSGNYVGRPMECKMIFINNTKSRYFTIIYGIYTSGDEERAAAFDELVASMKLE